VPGDSNSGMFGGNSNWRGPIWMCVNFLLIESLLRNYMYYGESLKVECPTRSGEYVHLGHVAEEIQHRLQHIFTKDERGNRACNSGNKLMNQDPYWRDYMFFHEFFHADTGAGLGASHQTGWTGLVAKLIHDTGINCRLPRTPRTPSTAAAHYFDDQFPRIKRPKMSTGRRASTRSIGMRSDIISDDVSDDWTGLGEEDAQEKAREVDDQHVIDYVSNTLRRVKSRGSVFDEEDEDEFETQLD